MNPMIIALSEHAEEAMDSLSNLCDGDDDYDEIDALSDFEKVRMRYNHADCDDFAMMLHALMHWDIICVNSPTQGPIHRLVVTPERAVQGIEPGRYVDFDGYVSEDDLRKRYKTEDLTFYRGIEMLGPTIIDDVELKRAMSVLAHLPTAPFNEPAFQSKLMDWLENGCYFDDKPPAKKAGLKP